MTRATLQFVHSSRPPEADVRVFDSLTRSFLGAEFTFRVIGSSHYVSAPAYDFHELSSCEPVTGSDGTTLALDCGPTGDPTAESPERSNGTNDDPTAGTGRPCRRLTFETDDLRCVTVVERRPLAAFPDGESFDLEHRFEEDAVTTVDVGTDGYETYHTYPEFDLALYTRTVFESVPGASGESVRVADAGRATNL